MRAITLLLMLWPCIALSESLPRLWGVGVVPVYHNPDNAVVPTAYAESEILRSIDAWNAVIDHIRLQYAGETDAGGLDGAIVINHVALNGVDGMTIPWTRPAQRYDRIRDMRVWISTIHRSTTGVCWRSTLMHEMGHAVGIRGHHADPDGVMQSVHCNTTPNASDIAMIPTEPLPEPEPPKEQQPVTLENCPAQLRDNLDLYFPAVWDGTETVEALLTYTGDSIGYTWRIEYANPVDELICPPLESDGADVIIHTEQYKAWLRQTGPVDFALTRAIAR